MTFSRVAGETSGSAYAITPTAVASNYAVTARTGTLSIIGFDTLLVTVGNSSAVYGSLSGNLNASAAYAKNTGTVNNPYTTVYTWTPTGSTAGSGNSLTLTFSDATALAPNVNTISVTISSAAGATSNVGTYAITAATPVNTSGSGVALNYSSIANPINGTLTITPLALTVSGTSVAAKTYDGTKAATIANTGTLVGVVNNDAVALTNALTPANSGIAVFANAGANPNQAVTITGMSLTGAKAANYTLSQPSGITGVINPKALTISGAVVASKIYDGGTTASISAIGNLTGIIGSDQVSILNANTPASAGTAAFNSANVSATQATSITGVVLTGSEAANYTVIQPSGITAAITPLSLTVAGTSVASKVYDGSTAATISNAGTLVGVIGGDAVSILNAGTPVTSGVAIFNSANANVAQATTISGMSLTGAAAGNYTLVQPSGITAAITQKSLAVTGAIVANKVYDTTTIATISSVGSLDGVIAGDVVAINSGSALASFASANVAYNSSNAVTSQAVNISGYALSGAAAGNYTIAQPTGVVATITPKRLTISGVSANTTKVYDATNTAILASSGSLSSGATSANDGLFYSADAITLNGSLTASYNSANVANANLISFNMSGVSLGATVAAKTGNYLLAEVPSVAGSITPKALTMSGLSVDSSKVYDGTISAVVSGTPTLASAEAIGTGNSSDGKAYIGDSVAIAGTAIGAYNLATVAGASSVAYSGLSLTGSEASNYRLTMQSASAATITPAPLSVIGMSVSSKTYDRTNVATANTNAVSLLGVVAADAGDSAKLALSTSGVTATFASANVAYSGGAVTSQTVTASGFSLTGASAANYSLVQPTASGTINPLAITITASAANKAYDGTATANATLATSNTIALADIASGAATLALNSASATFPSVNTGNGLLVTVSGVNLSGTASKNYLFNTSATTTADITKAALTITAASDTKVYGDTSTAGGQAYIAINGSSPATASATATSGYAVSGLIGSDAITSVTLTSVAGLATTGVGNAYVITPSDATGTGFANYTISYVASTMAITPAVLTISATGINKVYDSATTAGAIFEISGIKNGDSVTATPSSVNFASANVGNGINVTASGITINNANYTANTSALTTANITPAPLTITATGVNKTYNGNAIATVSLGLAVGSGVQGSDASALTFSYGTASFASSNVAYNNSNVVTSQAVSVAGIALGGSVASNYTFNTTASTSATINPAVLTITASAANKAYDRSTTASVTLANNAIAGDSVEIAYTGASFADANAGINKIVTIAGLSLSGGSSANYSLNGVSSVTANATITPIALSITAANDSKVYGGNTTSSGLVYVANGANTSASISTSSNSRYTVSGLLAGDTITGITLTSVGGLAGASVNAGPYSIAPSAITGSGVANYTVTYNNGLMVVTPATITVSATASDKVYNGNAVASIALTPSGVVAADIAAVTVNYVAANFASKDVAYSGVPAVIAQDVNITGISLSGGAATNYTLAGVNSLTTSAKITPASLTVNAIAANKVYDNTDTASITLSANVISGDVVTLTSTGAAFATPNVAYTAGGAVTSQTVNVTGIALGGAQSGNYSLANPSATTTTTATIAPAPLTISAAANDKVYDGTSSATVSLTVTGLKGSDATSNAYSASYSSATFADPNVGSGIGVAINGLTVTNSNPSLVGNYTVANSVTAAANITPKALTVTSNAATMTYGDGYPAFSYSTSGWVNSTEQSNAATLLTGVNMIASAVNAGIYVGNIIGSGGVARNYSMSYVAGDLTINKATLTATLQNAAQVVGDTTPSFVFAYTGYKNGDTTANTAITAPSVTIAGGTPVTAGNYAITAAGGSSANYNITSAYTAASNSTLTVTPAQQLLITMGGADSVVYGSTTASITVLTAKYSVQNANSSYSVYSLTLTNTSGNTWRGVDSSNGGQISTFATSSNWTQFSNVGTYTSTITGNPANNYLVVTTASGGGATTPNFNSVAVVGGVLSVTPATLTITANNDSKVYGSSTTTSNAVAYTGTAGIGGSSSFTATGLYTSHDSISSVGLSSSGAVAAATVNGGPYAIAISNAQGSGLANYVITYVNGSMTVTPKTLTVSANSDAKTYGAVTTSSGVSYVGNSVTGPIAFTANGLVNGDTLYDVTLTSNGALASATVGGGTLTGANAGKYVITPSAATGSPGINSNYSLVYLDGVMTVTPAILTIAANNDSKVYGSTTTVNGLNYVSNTVTGSTGYTVTGLVNGDSVSAVTLSSVGSSATATVASSNYAITPSAATGTGLTNNYSIVYQNGAMTVTPKSVTVTADNASMNYGAVSMPTLTYTDTGLVNGDVFTGTLATTANAYSGVAGSASNAGNYSITQGSLTAGNNYIVTFVPGALTINPVALTVTANNRSTVYGVATPLGSSQFTSTGLVNGDVISGVVLNYNSATSVPGTVNAGTYANAITVGAISGLNNANYIVTTLPASLTITPAPLTVTANAATMAYGASSLPSLSYTTNGLVNGDSLTGALATTANVYLSGSAGSASNVGSYAITQGTLAASGNYALTFAPGILTVAPGSIMITGSAQSVVYGSGVALSAAGFTVTGLVNGDSVSTVTALFGGNAMVAPATNAGVYANSIAISSAIGVGLGNYAINYAPGTLTVTPAPLTVTANNQTMTYGSANLPSFTYASSGLVNGDVITGSLVTNASVYNGIAGSASNVGTYAITRGTLTASSNYTLTYVAATLNVVPANLTITANSQTTTYGTAIANLGTNQFSATGLVNGDVIGAVTVKYSGATSVAANINAGIYSGANGLVASNALAAIGTSLSNYSIGYVDANLIVNPAPLTVTANAQTMTYAANSLPSLTYTSSGLKNGDSSFTGALATLANPYNGTPGSASNIGNYQITQGNLSAGSNYAITYVPAAITVTPASLTISANAQSGTYGTAISLGTSAFTTNGLLNGDSVSSVGLTVAANAVVPGTSNAGNYIIVSNNVTGVRLSNYITTYQTGVLTINPKPINVVANAATMVYADSNLPTLTYQAVSGLVNGDTMTGALATAATAYNGSAGSASNVGTYAITQGSLSAGSNYAISYTPAVMTVTPANLTVTAADQSTTYGLLFVIPQSALSTAGLRNGDYVSSANILYNNNQVIPGALNAGTYINSIAISNAAGVGIANYNISYVTGNLVVNKGTLTVTAVSDSKFVSQTDLVGSSTNCAGSACVGGYAGAMISGFANGDTATSGALGTSALVITRTNASTNTAGLYAGVLMPGGLNPQNYTVQYVAGDYVIAPAQQLLVKMSNNTSSYGVTPSYNSVTAAYLKNDGTTISTVPVSVTGNTVSMNDGLGSTAQFSAVALNPVFSGSGNLSVGNYALGATTPAITGTNFISMAVVGGLNITPKQLAYADLGISGVTKIYDGSTSMNNLAIAVASGFVSGDAVSATASGTFSSKNVGAAIAYNLGVLINGADKVNYQIAVDPAVNNGLYSGSNGVITQLNSVTYTGPNSGGNWSNPANWTTTGTNAVGAIPDLSNVANVIIPVGRSVVYDNAVAGPVTSAVLNNGNVTFNLSSAANIAMPISGAGNVTIENSGAITLSGVNAYTGGTILNAGSSLIVGNGAAIGAPNISSLGTAINPASFSTLSAVTLSYLNITGGTTQLLSSITTTGAQTYSDLILGSTLSGTTALQATNANINFMGKIDGATAKSQSLVASAGSGVITIGDSVGSVARLNSITMTASSINILADIITAVGQTYNGNAYIGDASYIGRAPTVGFLFSGYSSYFQYTTPAITSTIKYLNMNPIYVRTLISEDPNVTFTRSVNDLVTNTHTLLVAAIAPDASAGSSAASSVNFGASVGNISPLYSLNAQVVVNQNQANSVSEYVGTVSLVGNVATFSDQTYRASVMTAQSATQPGSVTFSIYDPSSSITYLLPLQTSGAGVGQMNLQNPNSADTLTINGANTYSGVQNRNGTNNWGAIATITPALGYVPPTVIPPPFAPAAAPSVSPTYYAPAPFLPPLPPMPAAVNPVVPAANSLPPILVSTSYIAPTIQNSTNFVVYNPAQNAASVNVTMAPEVNLPAGSRSIAGMQAFDKDALIPKADKDMVNILVKVMIDGAPTTLATTAPIKGFKFTVPESLLPESIAFNGASPNATAPALAGVIERAVQSDGSPLPSWLTYDPESNTFLAKEVPAGAKALEIKIQTVKNGQILEESPPIVIDAK